MHIYLQSENVFGRRGLLFWSSQLQRSVAGLRLGFRVNVGIGCWLRLGSGFGSAFGCNWSEELEKVYEVLTKMDGQLCVCVCVCERV